MASWTIFKKVAMHAEVHKHNNNEIYNSINYLVFFITVTLQDMVKDYNEIRVGLQKLIQELENHYDEEEETPEGDNYAQVMRNFRNDAIEKFEELEVRYTSMDVAYKDVVGYYGENADQMKPDEFFGIFKTFTSSWEVKRLKYVYIIIIIFINLFQIACYE